MITHKTPHFTLLFGTQENGFKPREFYTLASQQELLNQPQFADLRSPERSDNSLKSPNMRPFASLHLNNLITLEQTHSTQGYEFTKAQSASYRPYSLEGDYLLTKEPNLALGISTADCLPILFYDPRTPAIALIHAGWKGTAEGIVHNALKDMHTRYATDITKLHVFLGPAARSCCYEVQPDFLNNFIITNSSNALRHDNQKLFFDNSIYVKELLIQAGVPAANINQTYNLCTICDTRFCSYRRDGAQALRQMTIAFLM